MKIATWNVNECIGITCDLDNQETRDKININNINEIISIINDNDFDIIAFQEYPTYVSENLSLTDEIISKTNLKYFVDNTTYDSFLFKGGKVGVAIFSKYEIIESTISLFGNPHMVKVGKDGSINRSFDKGIIKITINKDGDNYSFITGHAMAFAPFGKTEFDYPESYKPLEELINSSLGEKLVVLGDFNTEELFKIIPSISGELYDTVDFTTTKDYYEKRGEVHMDYILINNFFKKVKSYKIDNYSDHYVVVSEVDAM